VVIQAENGLRKLVVASHVAVLSRTLNSTIQLGNSLLEIPHSPRGFSRDT
jgi:hypothetical protein